MTHVEDSDNLRTTNQFVTQSRCLPYGINKKYTIVLLDIIGHLQMKDEKYLKVTLTSRVSTCIFHSANGPVMCGKERIVITSDFVIRRQPMLTRTLETTRSIKFKSSLLPPNSPALSALKTDRGLYGCIESFAY